MPEIQQMPSNTKINTTAHPNYKKSIFILIIIAFVVAIVYFILVQKNNEENY